MEAREAISKAKAFAAEMLSDEGASQIRLEEIEFDRDHDAWLITIGVMRPSANSRLASLTFDPPMKRSYKIVKVPNDGSSIPSMKIRVFDETD